MKVLLGDGPDRAVLTRVGLSGLIAVYAGPGEDRVDAATGALHGGPGRDLLRARGSGGVGFEGGAGNDRLMGAASSDRFLADGTNDGSDSISGAGDEDLISYERRGGDISADLDGERDDGPPASAIGSETTC